MSGTDGHKCEESFKFQLEDVNVEQLSRGKSEKKVGEQLIVHILPDCFREGYGTVPRVIFVRECYRRLYDKVSVSMLDVKNDHSATLFTGVPGIGKSLFLVYFIYRFLHDDRFQDKT